MRFGKEMEMMYGSMLVQETLQLYASQGPARQGKQGLGEITWREGRGKVHNIFQKHASRKLQDTLTLESFFFLICLQAVMQCNMSIWWGGGAERKASSLG